PRKVQLDSLDMVARYNHYFEQWKNDKLNVAKTDSLREIIWTYAHHLRRYGQPQALAFLDQVAIETSGQIELQAGIGYTRADVLNRPGTNHEVLAHNRALVLHAIKVIPEWQERAYMLLSQIYANAIATTHHAYPKSFKRSDLTAADRLMFNLVINYLERAIAVQKSGAYKTGFSSIKHYNQLIDQFYTFQFTKTDLEAMGLQPGQRVLIDMHPYEWVQDTTTIRPSPSN
ncbi:MAG: hypothetical protein AAF564_22935, partial [Bacteroidota bacterium]